MSSKNKYDNMRGPTLDDASMLFRPLALAVRYVLDNPYSMFFTKREPQIHVHPRLRTSCHIIGPPMPAPQAVEVKEHNDEPDA